MADKIKSDLKILGDYLNIRLVAELIEQGHKATGSLINSVENKVTQKVNEYNIEGWSLLYGKFVQLGRRRGTKRVPIKNLIDWIKVKGFETDAKKVRGLVFAIQKTIFEKGISTPTSWKGTATAGWVTKTLDANEKKISTDIDRAASNQIEIVMQSMVREFNEANKKDVVKLYRKQI